MSDCRLGRRDVPHATRVCRGARVVLRPRSTRWPWLGSRVDAARLRARSRFLAAHLHGPTGSPGIVAVYASLFGVGKIIFGEAMPGIVMLVIAAVAFAWIARSFRSEQSATGNAHGAEAA